MKTVPVAEIFGPTIQGEGYLAGRPTYFLRVGGCDFSCLWCDSAHAVLAGPVSKLPRLTADMILEQLIALASKQSGPKWLTISGGNPALYELGNVVAGWKEWATAGQVAVETQGSKWKDWLVDVDMLTVSPKPPSSGMTNSDDFRLFMARADAFSAPVTLKVVVFDQVDYEFARKVHRQYNAVPFYLSCGTAMGGLSGLWVPSRRRSGLEAPVVDSESSLLARYRWLAETAMHDPLMADVAVLPQLHVLAWGHVRGV